MGTERKNCLISVVQYLCIIFRNPTPSNNKARQWRKFSPIDKYVEQFHLSKAEDPIERLETVTFWNALLPKISKYHTTVSIQKDLQNITGS